MEETNQNQQNQNQPKENKGKNIGMAIVAYLIFFIPLLTESKSDPFVRYHVKQGLVLFLAGLVAMVFTGVPVFYLFSWILNLSVFILLILGILNAVAGKEKPLPLIGKFAENFKF